MEKVRENCRERLRHSPYFLISLTNHLISFKQWSHLGLLSSPLPTDIASATPLIPLLTPHFMICQPGTHNCFAGHNHAPAQASEPRGIRAQSRTWAACTGIQRAGAAAEQEQPQLLKWCSLLVGWHGARRKSEQLPGSNSCRLSKRNRGVNLLCEHVMQEPLTIQMCKPQGQGCES